MIREADGRGVIARGLGRSYGDAAQNAGGLVLELPRDPSGIRLDEDRGTATVPGGVSLGDVMRTLLPRGWFVPVTPGTRHVTVGGAIAADIHGKNHHRDGSFGRHVRRLELVDGHGDLRALRPDDSPVEFWATVGGMGLTGVVTSATFSLVPVETAFMRVDTERLPNLDGLLEVMAATDDRYTHSVAWIDTLAAGRAMGRSILTRGEHASADELPARRRRHALEFSPRERLRIPSLAPGGLVNRATIRAFNEAWFRKAPHVREDEIQSIAEFFHPLDDIGEWNRLYGPRGFVQYQFVVPNGAEDALRRSLRIVSTAGYPSFLSVLKRFGAATTAPLSFPIPGWTLALDLPVSPRLAPLLDALDAVVLDAGGRVYLAKDARATPSTIAAMYPRLDEFRAVRRALDPLGLFVSDMARRLELTGDP